MPQPSKKSPAKKPSKTIVGKAAKAVVKKAVKKVGKRATKPVMKQAAKRPVRKASKQGATKLVAAKGSSIVETSAVTWASSSTGPSFEQVQLAAYHRWLQGGADDLDNWLSAEGDLRGKKR